MTTKSLLHRWFAAGDAGDLDAFEDYLHADVIVHAPLGFATQGIEAEKAVWKHGLTGVPDIKHDIQEVVSMGSTLAARAIVTGTHKGEFIGLSATGRQFKIDQGRLRAHPGRQGGGGVGDCRHRRTHAAARPHPRLT